MEKVNKELIAVLECSDSLGRGISELLQSVLKANNLNEELCVGNATDGAANMLGDYNGFSV